MGRRVVAVFEILLLTTIFVFFTAFVITSNQNVAITEHTEAFVELVRYKGCITQTMYNDFLNGFNTPIDVSITVERQSFLAGDGQAMSYEFTKDVVEALEDDSAEIDHTYRMQAGDNIQVAVRKPAGTLYDAVASMAVGHGSSSTNPVITIKGGMILNEQYAG